MALYEIVLCTEGSEEVCLTDQAQIVGDKLLVRGVEWRVEREAPPADASAMTRYVCTKPTPPNLANLS